MRNLNQIILFVTVLFITLTSGLSARQSQSSPGQDSLFVTIYNDNLGVIRDIRTYKFNPGVFKLEITDVATLINPTTVSFKLPGTVLEQNYQYDLVSIDKILHKYINEEIQLINEKGEIIEGTVLYASSAQVVLNKKGGGIVMIPNISNYRLLGNTLPEGLITKPTLVCLVKSTENKNAKVEMSYQTGGMGWLAEYVAVLNENDTKLDLNAWVSITNNSGVAYKNAKIKLIAGDVHRANDYQNEYDYAPAYKTADAGAAPAQFEEKSFYEYHLYTLERPADIMNNETKQITLFSASDINVTKKYLFKSMNYAAGEKKVSVILEFENKKENNLGVPMPKGKIRLYKSDGTSVEFIGEDKIAHTPVKEKLKIKTGDAFDVLGEETEVSRVKISDRINEITYRIKLKNRKTEDITIQVEKNFGNYWTIKKSNFKSEEKNASTAVWDIPVKAGEESTLEFTVRFEY